MAMAALRREGRRFAAAPLISPNPLNSLRSSEEQAALGVRYASTQVVRNRMKSVKNIQKITKAMKMVAASKLRAIQTRAENSRGLWQPFTALLGDTPSWKLRSFSGRRGWRILFFHVLKVAGLKTLFWSTDLIAISS